MSDETTATETEPEASAVVDALDLLAKLPEGKRRALVNELAPPPPGEGGRPLTREEAEAALRENPELFHKKLDLQLAGGPKFVDFEV